MVVDSGIAGALVFVKMANLKRHSAIVEDGAIRSRSLAALTLSLHLWYLWGLVLADVAR